MTDYIGKTDINTDTIIYRRAGCKKGVWHYRIALDGKIVRKSTRTTDIRRAAGIARRAWEEAVRRVDTGRPMVSRTFGAVVEDIINEWEASYSAGKMTRSRRYAYVHQTRKHLLPFFAAMKIDAVRPSTIATFVSQLEGAGLSPSSINNNLSTLAVIYRRAVEKEQIDAGSVPEIKRVGSEDAAERGVIRPQHHGTPQSVSPRRSPWQTSSHSPVGTCHGWPSR